MTKGSDAEGNDVDMKKKPHSFGTFDCFYKISLSVEVFKKCSNK